MVYAPIIVPIGNASSEMRLTIINPVMPFSPASNFLPPESWVIEKISCSDPSTSSNKPSVLTQLPEVSPAVKSFRLPPDAINNIKIDMPASMDNPMPIQPKIILTWAANFM